MILLLVIQADFVEEGRRLYAGTAYREALGHFEAAIRDGADARVWAGLAALRLGEVERARAHFEGADLAPHRLEEARAWASIARWDEALAAVEQAGEDWAVLELKGLVLAELGRADEALPLLDRVLENEPLRAVTSRLIRARAYLALERFADARADLGWIAREHPKSLWEREAARRLRLVEAAEQAARARALEARDPDAARDEAAYALSKAVEDLMRKIDVMRRSLGAAAVAADTTLAAIRDRADGSADEAVAEALEAAPEAVETLRGSDAARAFFDGQIASWRRSETSATGRGDDRGAAQARQALRILTPLRNAVWPP